MAEGAEKRGRRCDEHAKGARSSVEQRESANQVYAGPCRGGKGRRYWLARTGRILRTSSVKTIVC